MPMIALSARDRRALWRGALVVLAALVYTVGVRPSRDRRAQLLQQLEAERAVLARERIIAAEAAEVAASGTATPVADGRAFFKGADAVIASSSLVEHLASAADSHDVWLQQAVTNPPTSTGDSLLELQVSVRAESDMRGLLRWLAALERGSMLTQVQTLDVRSMRVDEEDGTAPLAIAATVRSVAERSGGTR